MQGIIEHGITLFEYIKTREINHGTVITNGIER